MAKVTILLIINLLNVFLHIKCTTLDEKEENCVNELQLNRSTIETWNIAPVLPEDNAEIKQYLACYWKKLGYLKENGELNYMKIGEVVHSDLKNRIHSPCLRLVAYVVDNCRNTVQDDGDEGLKAIRMWNCLNIQTENVF